MGATVGQGADLSVSISVYNKTEGRLEPLSPENEHLIRRLLNAKEKAEQKRFVKAREAHPELSYVELRRLAGLVTSDSPPLHQADVTTVKRSRFFYEGSSSETIEVTTLDAADLLAKHTQPLPTTRITVVSDAPTPMQLCESFQLELERAWLNSLNSRTSPAHQAQLIFAEAQECELACDYQAALELYQHSFKLDPGDSQGNRSTFLNGLRLPTLVGGDKDTAQTCTKLVQYASLHCDQSIQVAAIAGLERVGGAGAVLVLTSRILNIWGCRSVGRAITALGKLSNDGGLLALMAILLIDSRFYYEKLDALLRAVDRLAKAGKNKAAPGAEAGVGSAATVGAAATAVGVITHAQNATILRKLLVEHTTATDYYHNPDSLIQILTELQSSPQFGCDIAYGAILASVLPQRLPSWTEADINSNAKTTTTTSLEAFRQSLIEESEVVSLALAYAERRVPGLIELVEDSPISNI